MRGVPDDIVIWPDGQLDFVELKKVDGKLTQLQVEQIKRLTSHGQRCYALYGKTDVDLYFELGTDLRHERLGVRAG